MLVAIIIGNSSIRLGFFHGAELLHSDRVDAAELLSSSWYAERIKALMKEHGAEGPQVVIGSVVPALTGVVAEGAGIATGTMPFMASYAHAAPMRIDLESPELLGVDRIAVARAAYDRGGGPVAVVDFGTATTVNFVDEGQVFLGGAILPGPGLMLRALGSGTAALPEIEPRATDDALGRDTASAMLSGIIIGSAGAVMRIIDEVGRKRGRAFRTEATGGYAGLVSPHLGAGVTTDPVLALRGLRLMYEGHVNA